MATESKPNYDDAGVFELLSELCSRTASKHCTYNRLSQKRLSSKMRSHSYEIILRKTPKDFPFSPNEPIAELLSYYFVMHQGVKNTAQLKRALELKRAISSIRQKDYGEKKENIYNILRFLIGLKNNIKEEHSLEIYQVKLCYNFL